MLLTDAGVAEPPTVLTEAPTARRLVWKVANTSCAAGPETLIVAGDTGLRVSTPFTVILVMTELAAAVTTTGTAAEVVYDLKTLPLRDVWAALLPALTVPPAFLAQVFNIHEALAITGSEQTSKAVTKTFLNIIYTPFM
jgi:hypothetical protein